MSERKENLRPDVRIRLFDSDELAYGKGVNQLLLLCSRHHSLHKAADEMQMSYRKALQIVQRAERCFGQPLLTRTIGGKDGGGSRLTPFGEKLVAEFSKIEDETTAFAMEKLLQAGIVEHN